MSDITEQNLASAVTEIERLRQGLWDVFAAAGGDTDGDPTPEALRGDLVALTLDAVKELRADYESILGDIDFDLRVGE